MVYRKRRTADCLLRRMLERILPLLNHHTPGPKQGTVMGIERWTRWQKMQMNRTRLSFSLHPHPTLTVQLYLPFAAQLLLSHSSPVILMGLRKADESCARMCYQNYRNGHHRRRKRRRRKSVIILLSEDHLRSCRKRGIMGMVKLKKKRERDGGRGRGWKCDYPLVRVSFYES